MASCVDSYLSTHVNVKVNVAPLRVFPMSPPPPLGFPMFAKCDPISLIFPKCFFNGFNDVLPAQLRSLRSMGSHGENIGQYGKIKSHVENIEKK